MSKINLTELKADRAVPEPQSLDLTLKRALRTPDLEAACITAVEALQRIASARVTGWGAEGAARSARSLSEHATRTLEQIHAD